MGYVRKDGYERKAEYAARRNRDNAPTGATRLY